jgi:hypothetical protein
MTRNDLAVCIHSLFHSFESPNNHFFFGDPDFFREIHTELNADPVIFNHATLDIKSLRALGRLPADLLYRTLRGYMMFAAIWIGDNYYGFDGLESAISDLRIDSDLGEYVRVLSWFNGVTPDNVIQFSGTVTKAGGKLYN